MSDVEQVVCSRCGGSNRPSATRCWVCYSPLGADAAESGAPGAAPAATMKVAPKKKSSPMVTALKIVIVLSCVAAMIPILLIITCFGVVIFSSPGSFR